MLHQISWRRAALAGLLPLMLIVPLGLVPATGQADILPYGQSFETMLPTDPGALAADGWLVFGNVFSPAMAYLYGYGPFAAPNNQPPGPPGPAFSQVVGGQGGPSQGAVQLSVISDYENTDHALGNWIESNVFQERTVGPSNVGQTWYFEFDAKLGDLVSPTTAVAFIKTLDPNAGYALTNFLALDMTSIPITWQRYSVSLYIDAGLSGQLFQFGFANTATNYDPSGVYYDNIELTQTSTVDVPGPGAAGPRLELSTRGNPVAGRDAQVLAFTVPRDGRVALKIYDVTGALVATLIDGDLTAGTHQATWRGLDSGGRVVPAGIYLAEVAAGRDRAVSKLHRLR